jgi:hypothetical protein
MLSARLLLTTAAAVCLTAAQAHAAVEIERMELDGGTRVLKISGEFEFSDEPSELVKAASEFRPDLVTFQSGGGNVTAALRFGRAIRQLGLTTLQLRSAECASACTLAYMGGAQRMAEPGSIGVHQSSFSEDLGLDSRSAVAAVQSATAQIITYMVEMGVDPQLLELSLSTESSDLRYLTASEMRRYRVTTEDAAKVPAARVAAAPVSVEPSSQPAPIVATKGAPNEAADFIRRYFRAWSGSNSNAIAFMRSAYSDRVDYYGKPVSSADVVKEKEAFAKRWPLRAYSLRNGSTDVTCEDACSIQAVVEWYAHSDQRQKTSSGAATISLEWDRFSGQILSETSKVIKTDKGVTAPDRLLSQWHDENGECRGGSGDKPETLEACDRREELSVKIGRLNWCYGREGEYGYQNEWHQCGPTSLR